MWFFGVEVEQETSAPPPKKILDPPLLKHDEGKPLPKGQLEDRDSVYLKPISGTEYSEKLGRVVCGVFSPTRPTIYIDSKKNSLLLLRIRHTFLT